MSFSYAQEGPAGCDIVMINPKPAGPSLVSSEDAAYIGRLQSFYLSNEKRINDPYIYIFKWEGSSSKYIPQKGFPMTMGFPSKVFLSDQGNVITLGRIYSKPTIDKVVVYGVDGNIKYEISGDDVFDSDEIAESILYYKKNSLCAPVKPWICWANEPYIDNNEFYVTDTLGNKIGINLDSGKIQKKPSLSKCEMFE